MTNDDHDDLTPQQRRLASNRFCLASSVFPFFLQHAATCRYNATCLDMAFNAEESAYAAALEAFTAADAFLAAERATTHFSTAETKTVTMPPDESELP